VTPADYLYDLLKHKTAARIETVMQQMTRGVDDYIRYRELVAEIRAYSTALSDAKEALKAVTEDPDDE
jgi:hypothetical protein